MGRGKAALACGIMMLLGLPAAVRADRNGRARGGIEGEHASAHARVVERLVVHVGQELRDNPETAGRVDEALQRVAEYLVTHYGSDLTDVISSTIERWDTAETSRRLELQVGRDLQFIRINGTVVGSLAGLLIYTLTQVF